MRKKKKKKRTGLLALLLGEAEVSLGDDAGVQAHGHEKRPANDRRGHAANDLVLPGGNCRCKIRESQLKISTKISIRTADLVCKSNEIYQALINLNNVQLNLVFQVRAAMFCRGCVAIRKASFGSF
jgi:hypothetical protein